jgi:hypothetical protein
VDEKTEQLRDIFMAVSDDETVTETQGETRGSVSADEERVATRLREIVEALRQREAVATDLSTETYVAVVRAFYEGADDATTADRLDLETETVVQARLDLHLVREADRDAPVELDALRNRHEADDETIAADLGVDPDTVAAYRRVVAAEAAARAVNYRYRSEFEELLADADLSGRYLDHTRSDGLREAAEDIETDVSF